MHRVAAVLILVLFTVLIIFTNSPSSFASLEEKADKRQELVLKNAILKLNKLNFEPSCKDKSLTKRVNAIRLKEILRFLSKSDKMNNLKK